MKIENTNDIKQPWIHACIYGDSGSGKTTAASTFPRPLFIVPAAEGSELSLRGRGIDFIKVGVDEHGRAHKSPTQHMNQILSDLENRYVRMIQMKDEEAFPWHTIVIESLTHYCDMIQDEISGGFTKAIDQRGWGILSNHLRSIQSRLRKLDVHAVFIALAQLKDEDENGKKVGMPSITGAMAMRLPTACDIFAYSECIPGRTKEEITGTYRMHFVKRGPYMARVRFNEFPPHMDDFSYEKIAPLCGLD